MTIVFVLLLLGTSILSHAVIEKHAGRYLVYRELIPFGPAITIKVGALRFVPVIGYICTGIAAAPLFIAG